MPEKAKRKKYNITPEEFVVAWQRSESAAEAAKKLNMPKATVQSRASAYRRRGVNLKHMGQGGGGLDVGNLNNLASPGPDAA